MELQDLLNALMGVRTPTAPVQPVAPTLPDPYMMPGKVQQRWPTLQADYSRAQTKYTTDQADYETAMKDMKDDAANYLKKWTNEYPAAATAGQAMKAPEAMSMGPLAPVDEMALYGRPQAFPGITSITNLKRRTA
jgi:hypothetical protein